MKKSIYFTLSGALMVAALGISSCSHTEKDYSKNDIVARDVDTTVNPGNDFFMYANGGWIKKNPIPPAYSSWGIGNLVVEEIRDKLKTINEDAVKAKAEKGTNTQKIGDFYSSGMDSVAIDKKGLTALQPQIDSIENIKTKDDVIRVAAYLTTIGAGNALGPYIAQDDKNSSKMMLQLFQTGLGLPNRDYYFNTDSRTVGIRKDYQTKHLPTLFSLAGADENLAKKEADGVYQLEAFLAKNSRKLEDLRDPYANYHKMAISALDQLTPDIKWQPLLKIMHFEKADSVIVGQPEYYQAVNTALSKFSVDTWKAYLKANLVSSYASFLSKPIDDENFRFYGTVLSGRTAQLPRWKRIIDAENRYMGEILGQLFVKEYFPEKTKKRYSDLVEAIRTSLKEHINNLDWMTPETKAKALEKLNALNKKVGYPDKWRDYSTLEITPDNFAANVMSARVWSFNRNADKLGKPVDRDEWNMNPQTYNAYYNPSNNEIVLPAAIFTIPGVPDEDADDAIVYGYAAASTIGHEITHGFDDQGRQYDAKGNLKGWWTPKDSIAFTERAQKLVDQFNSYVVLDSLHVNGKATLGENIADLGGIVLGLDAFKKTEQYKEGKKINGFTPLQRYFLGYAMGWLGHERDQALANQILTDVHSPAFLRVNGPFTDVDDFYKAFDVKPGDKMYLAPDKRVKIW